MAAKPIAVLFADSHLAPRAWASRPVFGDSYFSLSYIIGAAVYMGLPLVGAGDLLDRQENRSGPIVFMHRQLDRLGDLPFYYIQGQHEMDDVPWLSGHPATRHVHDLTFDLGGFKCRGLDFQPAGLLQEGLGRIEQDTDILFAHQVWAENMGSLAAPQGGMGDVPVVSRVFTGDYHVYREYDVRGKDGQPVHLVSPGSTCMQDISEPPDKYFVLLNSDGSFTRVPIPTRPLINWPPMYELHELEAFITGVKVRIAQVRAGAGSVPNTPLRGKMLTLGLPEELKKPLLRVTYGVGLSDQIRRAISAVGEDAFVFLKEVVPQQTQAAAVAFAAAEDGNVNGTRSVTLDSAAEGYLVAAGLEHLSADVLRLLQCGNPDDELRRIREEALA